MENLEGKREDERIFHLVTDKVLSMMGDFEVVF